jgi:hypothetical protein
MRYVRDFRKPKVTVRRESRGDGGAGSTLCSLPSVWQGEDTENAPM